MIITFCGHSNFIANEEYKNKMMDLLDRLVGDESVTFYLGNYGNFDNFAFLCCRQFKDKHPNSTLTFVTPYIDPAYLENHKPFDGDFDEIVYPDIENRPLRVAILYRNRYMVDNADIVVAYVEREIGGAYKTYEYAQKKGKRIYNISNKPL